VDLEEARRDTGGGDRAEADVELLRRVAEVRFDGMQIERVRAPALERRVDEEVVDDGLVLAPACEQVPASRERAEHGLRDAGSADARHDRIEGVASGLERAGSSVGRDLVAAGDGRAVMLRFAHPRPRALASGQV